MDACKSQILSNLRREILPLQGIHASAANDQSRLDFPLIENAFPNRIFPTGCMHEFINDDPKNTAPVFGFIAGIIGKLMRLGGICIWVSTTRTIFPPALKLFGIEPEQVIFIDLKKDRDVLYAVEEAMKCDKVTAVVGDIKSLSFKESRRFQLAAEKSRVTGFILRSGLTAVNTIACMSRWKVTTDVSKLPAGMPGVGYPSWSVELLKVRNGIPGKWQISWDGNSFAGVKVKVTVPDNILIEKIA